MPNIKSVHGDSGAQKITPVAMHQRIPMLENASNHPTGEIRPEAVDATDLEIPPKRRRSTDSKGSRVSWGDMQSCPPLRASDSTKSIKNMQESEDVPMTKESPESTNETQMEQLVNPPEEDLLLLGVLPQRPTGTQQMMAKTTTTMNQINHTDSALQQQVQTLENLTVNRLAEIDKNFNLIQGQNQHMAETANTLVQSLKTALSEMDRTQQKHEQMIQKNDQTVANLIQHSQVLWGRNRALGESQIRHQQELLQNVQQHQMTQQQTHALWNGQEVTRNQQTESEQQMLHMQQEMARLEEENRHRPVQQQPDRTLQPSPKQAQKEKSSGRGSGNPKSPESFSGKGPAPAGPEYWDIYSPPTMAYYPYLNYQGWNWEESAPSRTPPGNQHDGYQSGNWKNSVNHQVSDPGKITPDSRGNNPLPSHGYPNMMIDPCPPFTPNTFQNWKREVKLWVAGMPGATTTQVLAKLIHAMPLSTKTEALLYMESTEKQPESRSVDAVMKMMDLRYGRTDSERACSWLTAFTEFKRESNENYKDFWTRFNRCTAKLTALDMPMTQQVIFNRAIQALRLPDGQLPIILSALETRPDRFSVDSLREITIRMYETHRPKIDTAEVFVADSNPALIENHPENVNHDRCEEQDDNDSWGDSMSVTLESGAVFLMMPKKPNKPRNAPGMNEASRRGAVGTFRHIPNQNQNGHVKGKGGCLRCGDPAHHWKECPHPFREKLDPRITAKVGYGQKGKAKGKSTYVVGTPEMSHAPHETGHPEEVILPITPCPSSAPENVPIDNGPEQTTRSPSINDVWAQYYAQFHEAPSMTAVCSTIESVPGEIQLSPIAIMMAKTNRQDDDLPPILIDSGASSSVAGMKWFQSWKGFALPTLSKSQKEFHFGDGPAYPSLGTCQLNLVIPEKFTNQKKKYMLVIQVDVVAAVVPMLISQTALSRMAGKIDFADYRLELPTGIVIHLMKSPSGHILLPAAPVSQMNVGPFVARIEGTFSMTQRDAYPIIQADPNTLRKLSDEQIRKIHIQLGHCSQRQLIELLKFGRCQVNQEQINRIHTKCGCTRSVHRVTPPVVSSWVARFSGEIVAMDIIYPFTEFGIDSKLPAARIPTTPALLVVDSSTRFITCTLLKDVTTQTATQTFLHDWVMHFGKPKRIILDQGGPGFAGHEWENLSHVFGWQYIKAPTRASHQNGLAERSVRSLKAAIQSIALSDGHLELTRGVITLAVIAKNHAPRTVTGLPPAFAMTGRCDIVSGSSTCMWQRDPLSHDSFIPQMNSLRKILDARNAITKADSEYAIKTCLNHNLPDGKGAFFPIGSSVQIAVGKDWIGTFRVIAHSAGNLLVERGNKILKWPRCRTRLVNQEHDDAMDSIPMPRTKRRLRDAWRTGELPDDMAPNQAELSEEEMELPEVINIDDEPIDEGALVREVEKHANLTFDSPLVEDSWGTGLVGDTLAVGTQRPESSYHCHGAILCEDYAVTPMEQCLDQTFLESLGPESFLSTEHGIFLQNKKEQYSDEDVLGNFDPSRIPPRVAFRLNPAREAIEKEVNDLLTAKPNEPPAMIQVSLSDSRFKAVPRVQSTLVVKRKGVNQYKGRLCVRGDTVPLNTTAFISSPTVHRSGVKVVCALAAQMKWTIHAIDISQAFLQSSNLNAKR